MTIKNNTGPGIAWVAQLVIYKTETFFFRLLVIHESIYWQIESEKKLSNNNYLVWWHLTPGWCGCQAPQLKLHIFIPSPARGSPLENERQARKLQAWLQAWLQHNPKTPVGRIRPTRIDLISPRRRRVSAGLHATDTLWHAYIDFLTYSDDHPSRQSGLCPSWERSRTSTKDINGLYRSFPAVFEWLSASKGYTMHCQCRCITLRRRLVVYDPRELTYELTRFRLGAGASRLACTQQTHCG